MSTTTLVRLADKKAQAAPKKGKLDIPLNQKLIDYIVAHPDEQPRETARKLNRNPRTITWYRGKIRKLGIADLPRFNKGGYAAGEGVRWRGNSDRVAKAKETVKRLYGKVPDKELAAQLGYKPAGLASLLHRMRYAGELPLPEGEYWDKVREKLAAGEPEKGEEKPVEEAKEPEKGFLYVGKPRVVPPPITAHAEAAATILEKFARRIRANGNVEDLMQELEPIVTALTRRM